MTKKKSVISKLPVQGAAEQVGFNQEQKQKPVKSWRDQLKTKNVKEKKWAVDDIYNMTD